MVGMIITAPRGCALSREKSRDGQIPAATFGSKPNQLDASQPLSGRSQKSITMAGYAPKCMDRLPFASEGVLSEVADMYPAC
jgi:hypothetical protein